MRIRSTAVAALVASICSASSATDTIDNWDDIEPSPDLQWTPCFQNYTCMRLQVPLDHGDPSRGSTAIAFIKLAAKKTTENTRNVIINPGGPGNSGINFLRANGIPFADVIQGEHNVIGFDPRGIGHSGPHVDCWPDHPENRAQFEKLFYAETSYASSTSLSNQFYSADFFGKACTPTVGGANGSAAFVGTPAVARDMLSFIKAEQRAAGRPEDEAKLSYYGISYGTVLGATFAHLFPEHVGPMILDGVVDAEDVYNGEWEHNLFDADKAIDFFYETCFHGGSEKCAFWGPSVKNIQDRFERLLDRLQDNPIPVASSPSCSLPLLATYSGLKQIALQAVYSPLRDFAVLAETLAGLEKGDASAYMAAVSSYVIANLCNNGTAGTTPDIAVLIRCVDGSGGSEKFETLEHYRNYVDRLHNQSRVLGEVWPIYASLVPCRSLDVQIPETGKLHASILEPRRTATPIMFVTSEIDPVTPKQGAYKMSQVFQDSMILIQNSVGHTAIASASSCLIQRAQVYYSHGELPPPNTVCEADAVPF
ncbi:Alpha/Beta hydrolase protein [Aspergillus undulatus]|uniref:Alpha/Beta hydrolase protein n=1 Tax=Aspergillus undulatus TaxID=1810928 RepID=UPI003CCE46B8